MSPQIAVVTAAYNMERFVRATIDSVLAQTMPDFEMIVVDDGSTDATAAIVASIDDARVTLISIGNGGVSAARNRGLASCRAPLVVFLDADDLLVPETLERMVAVMATHPDHVACFGHHVKIGEDDAVLGGHAPSTLKDLPKSDTLHHLICKNIIVNGGALCMRTTAATAVGGYDPTLRFAEDWEFWCRLAALGDFVTLSDFVALKYRLRRSSANKTLAGTPFRPNLQAIDTIYAAPALRARFGAGELRRCRRLAEVNVHWAAARNELTEGRLVQFAKYLLAGAVRYPDSLFQPRLIYLFFRGLPLSWQRN